MAITDNTYPWADRHATGTLNYRNIYAASFGYTETKKKVAAGTATAVLGSTSGSATAQTVTANITQPDVPRALSVTPTANATGSPLSVVVTGTNVEGKVITEAFIIPVNSTTVVNGVKAFKSVTSVAVPGNTSGLTVTVGTQNVLGINHRLFKNNTTVKVYSATAHKGALTLQGVPTVTASAESVELNTVQPLTAPGGTTFLIICYVFGNWALAPFQDQPEYSTTTSTSSTSSSTSTTTITTSTSSTSSSTSSTSSSVSSTSISTSSTSSSTTTAP